MVFRSILKALVFFIAVFTISCAHTNRAPQSTDYQNTDNSASLQNEEPETLYSTQIENELASFFNWPVDEARLTRGYIPKPTGRRKRPHWGLDLAARKNTPIFAAHDGLIIYSGKEFKGYGRMIMIEGKHGWASLYAHLTKSEIKEGQYVKKGQLIGLMGRSGRATGTHLHFELRKDKGPVDPLLYLPKIPIAKGH